MAQTTSQIAWIEGLSPADPPRRGLELLSLVGRKSSANDFFERAIAHYMNDFEVRKRPDWAAGLLYIARRVHLLPAMRIETQDVQNQRLRPRNSRWRDFPPRFAAPRVASAYAGRVDASRH